MRTFFILRRFERYIINVRMPSCTLTARYYYYQILKKDKICRQIFGKKMKC